MISKLIQKTGSFLGDEDATTAVEYAVMLGLIILVCVGSVLTLGTSSDGLWNGTLTKIQTHFAN